MIQLFTSLITPVHLQLLPPSALLSQLQLFAAEPQLQLFGSKQSQLLPLHLQLLPSSIAESPPTISSVSSGDRIAVSHCFASISKSFIKQEFIICRCFPEHHPNSTIFRHGGRRCSFKTLLQRSVYLKEIGLFMDMDRLSYPVTNFDSICINADLSPALSQGSLNLKPSVYKNTMFILISKFTHSI